MKDSTQSNVKIYRDLQQGTDEWLAARCGLITASEMKLLLTPTLKIANNDKTRTHLYELAAQRISNYVEPMYQGADMERGHFDEVLALQVYAENVADVEQVGFITNNKWGFTLGYSPDALVGEDGLAECKSRCQKYQVQTIIEHVATGGATIPADYVLQHQAGLIISEREWIDFISYSGGLPMAVIRVWPDDEIQSAILEAAEQAESKISELIKTYRETEATAKMLFPTERIEDGVFI